MLTVCCCIVFVGGFGGVVCFLWWLCVLFLCVCLFDVVLLGVFCGFLLFCSCCIVRLVLCFGCFGSLSLFCFFSLLNVDLFRMGLSTLFGLLCFFLSVLLISSFIDVRY